MNDKGAQCVTLTQDKHMCGTSNRFNSISPTKAFEQNLPANHQPQQVRAACICNAGR